MYGGEELRMSPPALVSTEFADKLLAVHRSEYALRTLQHIFFTTSTRCPLHLLEVATRLVEYAFCL